MPFMVDGKQYVGMKMKAVPQQPGHIQAQFAERIDKSAETISNIALGRRIPREWGERR